MPWTDSSPVQNVPSTPHLGKSKCNPETPVALVPEKLWFDSPGFDYTVPGTPIAPIQIPSSPVSCRTSCDRQNPTSDICRKCFSTRTPTLSYRRRNLSKDWCFNSPNVNKDTPSKKEQVVPGTPYNPGKPLNPETPYNPGTPHNHGKPYNPGTPYNDGKPHNPGTPYNHGKPHNPGTPYNLEKHYNPDAYLANQKRYKVETHTPERQYLARKRQRMAISPEPKPFRNKASINLFRGDDIFG